MSCKRPGWPRPSHQNQGHRAAECAPWLVVHDGVRYLPGRKSQIAKFFFLGTGKSADVWHVASMQGYDQRQPTSEPSSAPVIPVSSRGDTSTATLAAEH